MSGTPVVERADTAGSAAPAADGAPGRGSTTPALGAGRAQTYRAA